MTAPALELRDLTVAFRVGRGWGKRAAEVRPVEAVSLTVSMGESLGLVGESGCGKTTLARASVGLLLPTGGSVLVAGRDLAQLRGREARRARRLAQLVFQDPAGALNPRLTAGAALAEALAVGRDDARNRDRCADPEGRAEATSVGELLAEVELPGAVADAWPHELSGGQRQRVVLARALAARPRLLVADEPTSALDVPVQARVLNLLRDVQMRRGVGLLLVSHDLPVVRHACRRIAVMYLGRLVELFPTDAAAGPRHPYSRLLAATAPSLAGALAGAPAEQGLAAEPPGEPPSLLHRPSGCPYHPRCPLAQAACREQLPPLVELSPEHLVRCPPAVRGGGGTSG